MQDTCVKYARRDDVFQHGLDSVPLERATVTITNEAKEEEEGIGRMNKKRRKG